MKVVELFAGVGGFRLGLERAGHKIIFANEWDKYACDTYEKNFKDKIDRRDITIIPAADIPDHDLICGGFPCQAFSIAGKRKGLEETRGTLFFEIMRIARAKRTKYLFLENVKGLLNHDEGKTFEIILKTLDESGYDCQWQVLNSKDFGVPQNRERIFIVGHLRGQPRPQVFPLGDYSHTLNELQGQYTNTLTTRYEGGQATGSYIIEGQLNAQIQQVNGSTARHRERVYGTDGIAPTITAKQGGGHEPYIATHYRIRRLTPIECERLQSFPDNWTRGVSDTQRYKQMGNAVTVNVIEAIARCLNV